VAFARVGLAGGALARADLDTVGRVGPAPLAAAFAAGIGDSSSESSPSESSSLSLSLGCFAEALAGSVFEGTVFGMALVTESEDLLAGGLAPFLVVGALVAGSSSDPLSLDSEEVLALGGGALDCYEWMNFISVL